MQTLGCGVLALFLLVFSGMFMVFGRPSAQPSARPSVQATTASAQPGEMVLAIAPSPRLEPPPAPADLQNRYVEAVDLITSIGIHGIDASWTWTALEPSAGTFNFSDVDGMDYMEKRGFQFEVAIQLINT